MATVVHVEGSSYRRPGARMLIAEDGRLTGAISGGCLEGDAMRKALNVINAQQSALVTYDTMDEDDATIGIGLGCNGIIKILIEPIQSTNPNNPLLLLKSITKSRQHSVIATFFSLKQKKQQLAGTMMCLNYDGEMYGNNPYPLFDAAIREHAHGVLRSGKSKWVEFSSNEEDITVFLEFVPPAVSLVVVGAGNDVMPLVDIADILGWETTVIDGRANYARKERFAKTCDVILAKPEQVIESVNIDDYTFFALMTHNYNYDKALIYELCRKNVKYIAMLGPRKKFERMLSEFEEEGRPLSDAECAIVHSPAGLDIGAETSEEIALSILAEIKAFMSNTSGTSLKFKSQGIHA